MGKKLYITGGVIVGLVALYTAGGFWGVPAGINWALTKYADPILDRKATTTKVEFNPYTLHLNIQGLNIQKEGDAEPLLNVGTIDTKVNWNSVFKLAPLVDHLSIDKFQANIVRTGFSEFNFSDIVENIQKMIDSQPKEEEKKPSEPQRFSIDKLSITNSGVKLDDKFRDRKDTITDLNFELPLISNFQEQIDSPITPKLSFNFDGKPFDINANSLPFTITQKTGVDFNLKDVNLNNLASFNPIKLNAHVQGGTLSAKLNLAFANEDADKKEIGHLRLKGRVEINDLVIQDIQNQPYDILKIKQLNVNLKDFAFFRKILEIGEVKIVQPEVVVTRYANGMNVTDLASHLIAEDSAAQQQTEPKEEQAVKAAEDKPGAVEPAAASEKAAPDAKPQAKAATKTELYSSTSALNWLVSAVNAQEMVPNKITEEVGAAAEKEIIQIDKSLEQDKIAAEQAAVAAAEQAEKAQAQAKKAEEIKAKKAEEAKAMKAEEAAKAEKQPAPKEAEASAASKTEAKADAEKASGAEEQKAAAVAETAVSAPQASDASSTLKQAQDEAKDQQAAGSSEIWKWSVDKITIESGIVKFTDETVNFKQNISPLNVTAGPVSDNLGNPINFAVSLGAIGGTVEANGSVVATPLKANVTAKTSGLTLPDINPYLAPFVNARIAKGALANDGSIAFSMSGDTPDVHYAGNVNLKDFALTDEKGNPVASFADLAVGGIDVTSGANFSVGVQNITLANPIVTVSKASNGVMNVQTLAKSSDGKASAKSSGESKTKASSESSGSSSLPAITLGSLQISNGDIRYIDNAMKPAFRTNITKLKGSVSGFTTTKNAPANINFSGLLNGTPLKVKGSVNPFATTLTLNLDGEVTNLSMPAFSPFSAQFTGYPITEGLLTYKGNYSIDKDELKSTNVIVINHLAFGDEVPNAKDTLPVKLAVSLLQDRSGQIDLDIPVSGSLNDPEFSVGAIVVKVIVNLITKAVTAPFSLIGSMFGGESMDLNNLQFVSGQSEITPDTMKALAVIAKAMNDRPGIKIQIKGIANEAQDKTGLEEKLFNRHMTYALFKSETSRNLSAEQQAKAIDILFGESTAPNKPANATAEQKKQFLLDNVRVTNQDYQQLADARSQAVRNYLIQNQKINAGRLFIVAASTTNGADDKAGVVLQIQQ